MIVLNIQKDLGPLTSGSFSEDKDVCRHKSNTLSFSFEELPMLPWCPGVRIPLGESACVTSMAPFPSLIGGRPFHILVFLYLADSVVTMLIVIFFCPVYKILLK